MPGAWLHAPFPIPTELYQDMKKSALKGENTGNCLEHERCPIPATGLGEKRWLGVHGEDWHNLYPRWCDFTCDRLVLG